MPRAIRRRVSPGSFPGLDQLPVLLARLFAARGISDARDAGFELRELLPPHAMLGLPRAAARLADAIIADEMILVVGDYDADGATSSALALLAMRAMGARSVDFLVPNRFEFGYGLSPPVVELAARRSPRLIVTVDNGIASIAGVAEARKRGIEVLITDHHLAGEELPDAFAIVNPNQPGCAFQSKNLAGVGVLFYLMSALRAVLRERGWFAARGIAEPNLAQFLDLVAVGTVADLVALDRNNRILVEQGLRRIRGGESRPGIRALLEIAGRAPGRIASADIGFAVAPRINAAGRLDDMSLGIRCLLEDDYARARELALELDRLNRERRSIESGMREEALAIVDGMLRDEQQSLPRGLCLYREEWHEGVVGLVASRLKEHHHRPAVVFAPGSGGELKGSGRSIAGFHLRDALAAIDARHPGLISRFGGHAMAAGLALPTGNFQAFAQAFDAEVKRCLDASSLERVLDTDGELAGGDFTLENAALLREAAPWGQQFPEPLFDGEFIVRAQRLVGERHLRLQLSPCAEPRLRLSAIAFNVDTDRWPDPRCERVALAYRLDVNEYRGERELQLRVEAISSEGWPLMETDHAADA